MENEIVRIQNLCKNFGEKEVLKNINLSVAKGELFVLVGPDGAGKTTFLRILSSVYRPSSGEVNFFFTGITPHNENVSLRDKIGYMAQTFSLYEDLSVVENLNFFADMFLVEGEERKKRIKKLLAFSKLQEFIDRPAGKLSGGMQKKLALACTLIHEPEVLLLDEPTNGVDPISRGELWDILYSLLESEKTIILTTPYMEEAEKATHVGFIINGSLKLVGKPDELKKHLDNYVYIYSGDKKEVIKNEIEKNYGISYFVGRRLRIILHKDVPFSTLERLIKSRTDNFQLDLTTPSFEDIYLAYTKGILGVSGRS